MTIRSMFFDSVGGDRVYTSDAFAEIYAAAYSNGVVYGSGAGSALKVTENTPNALNAVVSLGSAWIAGRYFEQYSATSLATFAAANVTNPRIDRVVIRLDISNRLMSIAVLTGTAAPSPVAPVLTQTSSLYELPLAQVRVNANATTISNASITDERAY